jgi:hypothetical protein
MALFDVPFLTPGRKQVKALEQIQAQKQAAEKARVFEQRMRSAAGQGIAQVSGFGGGGQVGADAFQEILQASRPDAGAVSDRDNISVDFMRRIDLMPPEPMPSPSISRDRGDVTAAGVSTGEKPFTFAGGPDLDKYTYQEDPSEVSNRLFETVIKPTILRVIDVGMKPFDYLGESITEIPRFRNPATFPREFNRMVDEFEDRPLLQQILLGIASDPVIIAKAFSLPAKASMSVYRNIIQKKLVLAAPNMRPGHRNELLEVLLKKVSQKPAPPEGAQVFRGAEAERIATEAAEIARRRAEAAWGRGGRPTDPQEGSLLEAITGRVGRPADPAASAAPQEGLLGAVPRQAGRPVDPVASAASAAVPEGGLLEAVLGPRGPRAPVDPPPGGLFAQGGVEPDEVGLRAVSAINQAEAFRKIDEPGHVGKVLDHLPGISQIQRFLRPANVHPRHIQTAWVASNGEKAAFATEQFPSRLRILQRIDELFDSSPVVTPRGRGPRTAKPSEGGMTTTRFIGSESERVGIEGYVFDIAQRPHLYDLSPEVRNFLSSWQSRQSGFQQQLIDGYGAPVREFIPEEGSVFLSNVDQNSKMLEVLEQTVESAIRRGRGKTRVYDTAADRMKNSPDFTPVLDIRKLMAGMDESRSSVVGSQVFKSGVQGKTLVEVMDELHPALRKKKDGLVQKITNLKARVNTAERQMTVTGGEINRLSTSMDRVVRKSNEILENISEAVAKQDEDFSPEIAFLSGEIKQLIQQASQIERRGGSLVERATQAAGRRRDLTVELEQLAHNLQGVRRAYSAADLRDYNFVQEGIFRYFKAPEARAIRELQQTSDNPVVRALDNFRGTAFSGDLSPIAGVQLPLGILFQPHRAIPRLVGAGKGSIESKDLLRTFREETFVKVVEDNPQLARDFAFFAGIPVEVGTPREFAGGFLRVIPGFQKANERMFSVVLRQSMDLFDHTRRILTASGVVGDDASVVAADMATKVYPMWSSHRLGLSQARAAAIRSLPTSVSFILQPAALIGSATTGFVKLGLRQTLTPQEMIAVRLTTTMAGSWMALSLSTSAIDALQRGNDPVQAMKDASNPLSGKFGSVILPGGRRLPMGGPYRGLIKMIVPREVPGVPVPVPFGNILNFARNRLNPAINMILRSAENRDFQGGQIRKGDFPEAVIRQMAYTLESLAPLAAGTALGGVRQGLSAGEIGEQVLAQGLGINLGEETVFQRRDLAANKWANDRGIVGQSFQLLVDGEPIEVVHSKDIEGFYDLPPVERKRFEDAEPDIVAAIKAETKRRAGQGIEYAVMRQEAEELQVESMEDQLSDDTALEMGTMFPTEWKEKRKKRRMTLYDKREQVYHGLDVREPKTLSDYYFRKIDEIEKKHNGVMTDAGWEELEQWVLSQSDDVQAYLEENTGLAPMTAKEKEYKADMKALEPFWELPDVILETLFSAGDQRSYKIFQNTSLSDQALLRKVSPLPNAVEQTVQHYQMLYLSQNLRARDLLLKWEHRSSAKLQLHQELFPSKTPELVGAAQ